MVYHFMGYYDMYGNNLVRQAKLDDTKIKNLLSKISDRTAKSGIIVLFTEEHTLKSLDRAKEVLNTAKNEHDLQIIEAALQTAITEIREFNIRGSQYWDNGKTSLYLYTLQYLILNLNKLDLGNNAENKYTPKIVTKLQEMHAKCDELGINFNVMRQQCITTQYQRPDNDELRNFKFIDVNRVDAFNSRLKKYAVTHNKEDLFDSKQLYQTLPTSEQIDIIINKLTTHLERKFNITKLDLSTYDTRILDILQEINTLFTTADPGIVAYINKALYDRLNEQAKSNTPDNKTTNNDRFM